MKNQYFNIVVKKILKVKGKIINSEDIKNIVSNILESNYDDKKCYKIIYYLKNRGYLVSIKKNIFYVKKAEDSISENEIVEKFYWTILKDHCKSYLDNDRYIGGIKALELNYSNFDLPEEIDIVNSIKQSKESVLSQKFIKFKKYSSGKIDLFKKFKKYTSKIKFGKNSILVSNIELSILESLYNPDALNENYANELVKKILRKNKKGLNFKNIESIIKIGKHHTSINRLYKLSKSIDNQLANELLKIIKKYSFIIDA